MTCKEEIYCGDSTLDRLQKFREALTIKNEGLGVVNYIKSLFQRLMSSARTK